MRSCGVLQRPVTPSVQLPFVAFTSPFEPCAKPLELVHPLLPPLFAQLSLQLVNAGHGPEPGDRYVSSSHVPAVVTPVTNILHWPRVWQLQIAHDPPQSTPASPPFWMPSLQVGTWQWPSTQLRLEQSLPTLHARPSLQRVHVPPPQSTSVSAPF